jgi:hypothetical protein
MANFLACVSSSPQPMEKLKKEETKAKVVVKWVPAVAGDIRKNMDSG